MRNLLHAAFLLSSLTLVACGGSEQDTSGGGESAGAATTFEITGNDMMKFSETELSVPAGTEITINFKNVGSQPKNIMGHNLVVLQSGLEPVAFSTQCMTEGGSLDNNHLPEAVRDEVIAYTKVLGPGEEESISFTLEAGTYPYVCTFPGHAAVMNGKIIAK